MTAFFRFPHTPHLAWLGEAEPRDDKLLSPSEVAEFLAHPLVVEEKIDGANIGFSASADCDLRVQNRGSYLPIDDLDQLAPQFRPLPAWLAPRRTELVEALWPNLMLFGEWCVAVHSVTYDALPDYFVGFDVYDREQQAFWSTNRRDALLRRLGLHPVPALAHGRFDLPSLQALLGCSRVGSEGMEGLVARHQTDALTVARAKLVRASFTQAIEGHWSKRAMRRNALAAGASSWH